MRAINLSGIGFTAMKIVSITLMLILIFSGETWSQQIVVLPSEGTVSKDITPQGNLRFQRGFYLITPEEMMKSELANGSNISSIGFTIAGAQIDTTQGIFKVYLENTSDIHSRIDTTWTIINSVSNTFDTTGLELANYEWQVQTICNSDTSEYSGFYMFSTMDTLNCNLPENLVVSEVTHSSARLNWTSAYSTQFSNYQVQYKTKDEVNWTSVNTDTTSILINALIPDTVYNWQVRTVCNMSSDFIQRSFKTLPTDVCNEPDSLRVSLTPDSMATFRWDTAVGASYYDLNFRRVGTSMWQSVLVFADSVTIPIVISDTMTSLAPGSEYEWRVQTVCDMGRGAFVQSDSTLTTIGNTVCYAPQNLMANVKSDTSAELMWYPVPMATSYNIRYRLKNSISWDSAISSMTLVHCDSIIIPDTIGRLEVPFSGGSGTLNYSGQGLYVAWEYADSTGTLSTANAVLATAKNNNIKDQYGEDSISFVLSMISRSNEAAKSHYDIVEKVEVRPETWFGANNLEDSVEVVTVYALGHYPLNYTDTSRVYALIKNHSSNAQTYPVSLTVKSTKDGTVRLGPIVKNVTINGDTTSLVYFNDWVPEIVETDSIIISVPGQGTENVLKNNKNFYLQKVNTVSLAYDDNSTPVSSAGFGQDSSGLILCRYTMKGCGSVNAAKIFLDFSAKEKELYAVVMDEAGNLVDSSDVFTPDTTQVSSYHTFYFPKTPLFDNSDFYVGLAQKKNGDYNPVGVQWETSYVRDSAFYRADIDGTNLINHPFPGRLMIQAQLVPGRTFPNIVGNLDANGNFSLCQGATDSLYAGSKTVRFANRVISYSSEFSNINLGSLQALGAPDVEEGESFSPNQWIGETADGQREFIELGFSNPQKINFIDIYETLSTGAIDSVFIKENGSYVNVFARSLAMSPGDTSANVLRITFDTTSFDISEIRITLASDSISGFNGIDAVGIGLQGNTSSFSSYKWSTTSTDDKIEINTAGTYSVTVTDATGCEFVSSVEVITPVQIKPDIRIVNALATQDTTFCQGESIVLKSDQTFGFTWKPNDEMTDSIIVDTSGQYFLELNDGTGCGLVYSDTIIVSVDTMPIPIISGFENGMCAIGGSNTLSAGTYNEYSWSDNMSINPVGTSATLNVTAPGTFTVTVKDGNGCSGSSMSIATFFAAPPSPTISGNTPFCQGSSIELDAGTYAAYNWSTGAPTQKITSAITGTYSVTVTDNQGCTGSATVTTKQVPTPTPTIAGATGFCAGSGSTIQLVAVGTNLSSYNWSTGSNSSSITITTPGMYSVSVTDVYGCMGNTSTNIVQDGEIPNRPGEITGPVPVSGSQVKYSIAVVPNATYYVWTVPDGVSIVGKADSTTVVLDIPPSTTGEITVGAANPCGLSPCWKPRFIKIE